MFNCNDRNRHVQFRAPEILQTFKEKNMNQRRDLFTRAADAYSYGMTYYEISTGKLSFKDHPLSIPLLTDFVINQELRPKFPDFVHDWTKLFSFEHMKLDLEVIDLKLEWYNSGAIDGIRCVL